MSIQYGLVARESIPLAEYSTLQGNYRIIAIRLLENLNPNDSRTVANQGDHVFFCLTDPDRISFLVLSESSVPQSTLLSFCEEMQRSWRTRYGNNAKSFVGNSKDAEFGPVISKLITTYNDPRYQKIGTIKSNLDQTQNIMANNLSLAMSRGEQLNVMEKKAEDISRSAQSFRREANQVRWRLCVQRYMWVFIGVGVALLAIFVILLIACKPNFSKCKSKSSSPTPTPNNQIEFNNN